MSDEPTAVCPYCHERIAAGAAKCRHCGEHLVENRPRALERPQSSRLKAAGAMQFALGALAGLMVPCVGFSIMMQSALPPAQRQSPGAAVVGLIFYAVVAVLLLWSGVGAWQHRRWAR